MENKILIDGVWYSIEDEQQLEAEVDMYFPDEDKAIRATEAAIGCIKEAIEHLKNAEFETPQLLLESSQCSQDSLKKEVVFLKELIRIAGSKK